jgi:hypothetical protein
LADELLQTQTTFDTRPEIGGALRVALDQLSRSLRDVLAMMEKIQEAEAGFRSLTEAIDTIQRQSNRHPPKKDALE